MFIIIIVQLNNNFLLGIMILANPKYFCILLNNNTIDYS